MTGTTLRAVLDLDGLALVGGASHASLDREVRYVQSTELVDPRVYLRAAELVCTVGAALVDTESCRRFVEAVVAAHGAAIAFGIGDVHDAVPEAVVDACANSGLPLLTVAQGVPFLTISEFVIERRLAAERRLGASVPDLQRVVSRERVGQLIQLVGDRLASPEALRVDLVASGLDLERLTVAAFPAGASATALGDLNGWLLGETPTTAYALGADSTHLVEVCEAERLVCGLLTDVPLHALTRAIRAVDEALVMAVRQRRVVAADEMITLAGLLDQVPRATLARFVDRLLRPLRSSDPEGVLLGTLKAFIEGNRSVERAARAEFVHVNTVRHRLARVREITGRDPFDLDDLTALRIAIWAGDVGRADQRR